MSTQPTPQSNGATVPMIFNGDTSGQAHDIPFEQMHEAMQNGGKLGVYVKFKDDPSGKNRVVPSDQVKDAVQNGGTIVPIEEQPSGIPELYGFTPGNVARNAWSGFKGAISSVGSLAKDLATNPDWVSGPNSTLKKFIDDPMHQEAAHAVAAFDKGNYTEAFGHAVASGLPLIGPAAAAVGDQAGTGDVGGAVGKTAGAVAGAAALNLTAKGMRAGAGAAIDAAAESPKAVVTAPVRLAARGAETAINQKLVPLRPLANIMSPADEAEATQFKVPGRDFGLSKPAVDAGAPLPENPGTFPGAPEPTGAPEQINPSLVSPARSLPGQIGAEQIYGPRPTPAQPIPARAGLQLTGEIAPEEAAAAAPPPAATPKTSPAAVKQQLNNALGVEPVNIKPGVSMRNQAAAQGLKLPEGFTPVDSSVLKAYKYDPATQEFDAITNSGQRFRHAEVSPEQFKAFEDADSKGKAWNDLRNGAGVTPLGKVNENGVLQPRIKPRSVVTDPETGKPEFSDVLDAKQNGGQNGGQNEVQPKAKAAAAGASGATDDLTSLLQQSLDQVKAEKGGVRTTAAPADLAKRWGVDESSIEDTDRNVRGLNAQQSQTYINKLADSYQQGRPVEPVIETRDENNNITSVDGRHRALAAKKAGIERIPVIVRRISVQ